MCLFVEWGIFCLWETHAVLRSYDFEDDEIMIVCL